MEERKTGETEEWNIEQYGIFKGCRLIYGISLGFFSSPVSFLLYPVSHLAIDQSLPGNF